MRVRAAVEYDGTAFLGFQAQATGRTVQTTLEAALLRATGAPARVVAAGRTDTGVHAVGQVVHFDYQGSVPVERLLVPVNAALPHDVALRDCAAAPPGFHARYSAVSRVYQYRYLRAAVRSPLRERYAWRLEGPLDVARMAAGARLLVGEHSFRRFGGIPGDALQQQRSRGRHGWRRCVLASALTEEGDELRFTIEANAFLTHMVRALSGVLVALGRHRVSLDALAAVLKTETEAAPLAPLAPPHGLCLLRVRYGGDLTPGPSPAGEGNAKEEMGALREGEQGEE